MSDTPRTPALFNTNEALRTDLLDFNETAERVLDGVVHIKSTHIYDGNSRTFERQNIPDPFRDFFGEEFDNFFGPRFKFESPKNQPRSQTPPTRVGTGSGVLINDNGYIVTNNHVIADADDIEVTLYDNRTFKASVIGTDPSTDLAVIQIKEKNLATLPIGDSDELKIGQWVLAVGNPMGLNSTVTAGIVSAKGRNINILKDQYAIENFIQTDAAINPGNSGGALVNLKGHLIGINTAIASPTGTYAGYGFAIPTSIVSKVVQDLIEYGVVQRGVLGVMIRSIDGNFAKEKNIDLTQGVYVDSLLQNSAAADAGVKVGDVILAVDDIEVNKSSELQGVIARYRPGEEVSLKIDRKGKELFLKVKLNNREGNTKLSSKDNLAVFKMLGAELEEVNSDLATKLEIKGGVKVKNLYAGKLRKYTQMREGFIITHIDGKQIKTLDDMAHALENKTGGIMVEGIYEDIPGTYYYAFGLQ
jgi:Do/DeqQ family serine protease